MRGRVGIGCGISAQQRQALIGQRLNRCDAFEKTLEEPARWQGGHIHIPPVRLQRSMERGLTGPSRFAIFCIM